MVGVVFQEMEELFTNKKAKIETVIPAQAGIHFFALIEWCMKEDFYVYILASQRRGTLYIGVTSDLIKRIYEHKNGLADGFTKKYKISRLVYYEVVQDVETALSREKQMKKWNRLWKIKLIEGNNPEWVDLYDSL